MDPVSLQNALWDLIPTDDSLDAMMKNWIRERESPGGKKRNWNTARETTTGCEGLEQSYLSHPI